MAAIACVLADLSCTLLRPVNVDDIPVSCKAATELGLVPTSRDSNTEETFGIERNYEGIPLLTAFLGVRRKKGGFTAARELSLEVLSAV